MQSNFIKTLIMGGVLVVLIAWYFGYEEKYRPSKEKSEEEAKHFVTFDPEQIQQVKIEIKNEKGDPEVIELKRVGTAWTLLQPVTADADSASVSGVLSTLTGTGFEKVVAEKAEDLSIYGLKTPSVKVTAIKDSSTPPQEVWVGDDTPIGYSAYAKQPSSEKIYRVARSFKSGVTKKLFDLRDKKIIDFALSEISEVEIGSPKEKIPLKKNEKGNWILTRQNLPADSAKINRSLNAIITARAKAFVSEDGKSLEKFGLDKPALTLLMVNAKGKTTVALGKKGDKLYVKREDKPAVMEIDKETLGKIDTTSANFQDKALARFNRFEVTGITLDRSQDPVELRKEGENWVLPATLETKVDEGKVSKLLTLLQDGKLDQYLPKVEPSMGLDKPKLTLRLFEGEKESVTIKFGATQWNKIYALRSDLDRPFQISLGDYKSIDLPKKDFVKKEEKKTEEKASSG